MGAQLAEAMEAAIEEMLGEEPEQGDRGELIEEIASAGGISPATLQEILAGEIDCPPINRLEGFASALDGVSASDLIGAAEADGCEYDDRGACLPRVRQGGSDMRTKTRNQTEADKNRIVKQQTEAVEKALAEATDDAEKRAVLCRLIGEGKAQREALETEIAALRKSGGDDGEKVRSIVEDLQRQNEQSAVLVKRLYEKLEEGFADRNRGGKNANLRFVEDDERAMRLGAYILSRTEAGAKRVQRSERLKGYAEEMERALDSASGDTFVATDPAREIVGTVKKYSTALRECRVIPLATDKMPGKNRGTRAQPQRVDSATSIPESTPGKPSEKTATVGKYAGYSEIANELLEDENSIPSLVDLLIEDHADGIGFLLETDVTIGVAGAAHGAFGDFYMDGFLNNAAFTSVVFPNAVTFGGIDFANLDELIFALDERYEGRNLKFHFNRAIISVFAGKTDANGNFLWQPPAAGEPGMLRGKPYTTWRTLPGLVAADQAAKPFLAYGDMRLAYEIGERRGVTFDESRDYKFRDDQTAYRATARFAGQHRDGDALVIGRTAAV